MKNQVVEKVLRETTNKVGEKNVTYGFGVPNERAAIAAVKGYYLARICDFALLFKHKEK